MGNAGFGSKRRLLQQLRLLPALLILRAFVPHRRSRDYRVVVVGAAGVGKSTLMQRWCAAFRDAYLPALAETRCRLLGCSHGVASLHITDSADGRRDPRLQRFAIARGHAFVLVYSVTKRETLEELRPFYELIRKIKGSSLHKFPVVLVGNKSDERGREVTRKEGAAYALEWRCAFVETSAKADVNVQELFHMLLSHEKQPAAGPRVPPGAPPAPSTTEKLLGKCIVM
ncbi:GTP-binding protein Di-Ras3 [Carlito syrichta]|uniref:GTP-binding protein Di-Ras3 n=1 Tax=Carlito syrichta TaxID=1868482 RepID=A0A1U7SQC0_CARSF|nr:GTP-binding protein Di-Ras3 [Carlito syrichta]